MYFLLEGSCTFSKYVIMLLVIAIVAGVAHATEVQEGCYESGSPNCTAYIPLGLAS